MSFNDSYFLQITDLTDLLSGAPIMNATVVEITTPDNDKDDNDNEYVA